MTTNSYLTYLKGVISYRTNNVEDLRKIAKIKNVSLSTITADIIDDYLHNNHIKSHDLFQDGKKFISAAFENLSPDDFEKISTIGANECNKEIKFLMNNFNLQNLLAFFKTLLKNNNLKLSEFDEMARIRWICETNMGKNYNQIKANCFKNVLDNFGFEANVESFCNEYFELIFLKNNSH